MGSAASKPKGSERSERNETSKTKTKNMLKRKQSSHVVSSLQSSGWSSPTRFRELYDPASDDLRLSRESLTASSPSVVRAAQHATREYMNELYFVIAANSEWQQQQVRGLFAVYRKICLLTEERVLHYRAFTLYFFPLSSHHHFPPRVIRKLYDRVFDSVSTGGLISFPNFCNGISKCMHGQRRHKIRLVFDMFDDDNDGSWSFSNAADFLRAGMTCVKHLARESLEQVDMRDMLQSHQFEWWHQELAAMQQHMEAESQDAVESLAPSSSLVTRVGASRRLISFPAFRSWSSRLFRFRPFLARFDVLPTARDEAASVRALWSESRPEVGETWYVCSETWWRAWKAYSGFREPGEDDDAHATTSARNAMKRRTSDATHTALLLSDTDTDSDRDERRTHHLGGVPATPPRPLSRTVSNASSPTGIHIGLAERTLSAAAAAALPVAPLKIGLRVHHSTATDTTLPAAAATSNPTAPLTISRRNSASLTTGSLLAAPQNGGGSTTASTASSPRTNGSARTAAVSPQPHSSTNRRDALTSRTALRPTAIDNSDIASPSNALILRPQLVEHEDFLLLSSAVWRHLAAAYGVTSAYTTFPRRVVAVGRDGARTTRVDLYPLCIRVKRVALDAPAATAWPGVPTDGTCILVDDAAHTTARQLEEQVVDLFFGHSAASAAINASAQSAAKTRAKAKDALSARSLRMWVRDGNDYRRIGAASEDMTKTMEELEVQNEETLLVELECDRRKKTTTAAADTQTTNGDATTSSSLLWPMDLRKVPRLWSQFEVGDTIDARDKQSIWYSALIRSIGPAPAGSLVVSGTAAASTPFLTVHFIGWDEKWNESIPASSLCQCRGPCACAGRLAAPAAQIRFRTSGNSPGNAPHAGQATTTLVATHGLCGLQNLGNTCFMNSTLQCLAHTPYLIANYFLGGKHMSELNRGNALGHRGLLALEFASLVRSMWSDASAGIGARALAPTKFKRVLGDFAPHFDNYQQHDSHELLAFLLDGLHEDLNRVIKKVPTDAVESNGRSDAVVVREAWATYKLRNQSIVVDLFMGMMKSTIVCPEPDCGRVSITFDPFRYLTVPLPLRRERQFIITFCPSSTAPLVNYGLRVPEDATIGQIKETLATLCDIEPHRLLVCDVSKCKLHRVLMDNKRVSTLHDEDVLVAYEIMHDAFRESVVATPSTSIGSISSSATSVASATAVTTTSNSSSSSNSTSPTPPPAPPVLKDNLLYLQVIHKYIVLDSRGNASVSPRFGIPVCVTVTPHTSRARLHELVSLAVSRWIPRIAGRDARAPPPYTLRMVDHTCSRCGVCAESSNCGGCCLPQDDRACGLDSGFALCVLWESESVARSAKSAMDDAHIVDHASMRARAATDAPLALRDCIELFSAKETLSKEDAWYCSKCKAFRQATKQMQIFHAPEILIVHLKRFLQINRIRREKQSTMVDFPIRGLDLAPFIPPHALENESHPLYDLFAISNHSGGLSGGHYTSFCLHSETQKWYLFDDSRVTEATIAQLKTPHAYLLMYKRRG